MADAPSNPTNKRVLRPRRTLEVRFGTQDNDTAQYYVILPLQIADGWAAVASMLPWNEASPLITSSSHESLASAVEHIFSEILAAEHLETDLEEIPLPDDDPEEDA